MSASAIPWLNAGAADQIGRISILKFCKVIIMKVALIYSKETRKIVGRHLLVAKVPADGRHIRVRKLNENHVRLLSKQST